MTWFMLALILGVQACASATSSCGDLNFPKEVAFTINLLNF